MKTEINIYTLFVILFIHWVADFIFQTHNQAINKSKSNYYLTMHVLTYSFIWLFACYIYCIYSFASSDGKEQFTTDGLKFMLLFPSITFVCHWITDYFTSRLNSYLHKKGDIHNFFVSVGGDQLLHMIQLVLTFQLLS